MALSAAPALPTHGCCCCSCCLQGPEAKMILDAVIDACAGMQNLREGIFSYRVRFLKEAREKQRNVLLNVCLVRGR